MDEHTMGHGVIPLRHSSLPGLIKLPRRYEKAALGDPRTARHRKVSVCGSIQLGETLSDRLDDLTMAVTWVKQELILLRQHDILLKRQFFNIHDSIQSLLPNTNTQRASLLPDSSPPSHILPLKNSTANHNTAKDSSSSLACKPSPSAASNSETLNLNPCREYSEYQMETFMVRPAASVSLLSSKQDDSDYDSEGCEYHRPRTSSMKTSRDLAAVARRRGSKDLI
ncbi:unnamed protein product [Candidula unifasciata]|uniref:Uncharacterized protein n=1 Tax=Candidula unifasciata TaxID=100452 RepID=A0A8S3ZM87_9EUPU|nr:unnamed protein product [Candidula unifasciata]